MNADEILKSEDFRRCVEFHGHICPGLAIGYRAAKEGLERLHETRARDEELVAIVENDACGVDAVQVLTGCTFGKGNFIYKDHGKQVFTFLGRRSKKGVRLAKRADVSRPNRERDELYKKIRDDTASPKEQKRFQELHLQRTREILDRPADELFSVRFVDLALPPKAVIEPPIPCDGCGEPTMASRLTEENGRKVCGDCQEKRL
ncbi:MAG: formylmethanofuran dehydrogenase [Deltaproteobacteria bacterium]|nr:formylmethanofuran dehydrogenase [Deltaproteobacteria bacterium]MBW2049184.1 formylmethanofuran dehydrogenase [Deltaproteobacteria bacterium]MBW2112659.1 formylmethanofuran dehydrogenase [Deltaproteobacteria bacterium]